MTAYADGRGTILGIEAELVVDAGSYSIWPSGPFMETGMAARNLPGPYRIPALSVKTWTVATNKPPLGPYRGVARPGACFAIERTLDEVARKVGRDPYDVRRENMVAPHEMPFTSSGACGLITATIRKASKKRQTRPAWRTSRAAISGVRK